MPLVEIKVFENEFSEPETDELVRSVTDAIVSLRGESLREATWVVVEEVKSGNWGIGGKTLTLDDVREMQKQ